MQVYVYINRYLADPLFHADSFWHLPCNQIESVLKSLQQVEKERIQSESVTSAYLTDSLHTIAHAIYGSKDSPYESNPSRYLPGYEPEVEREEKLEGHLEISTTTIQIYLEEFEAGRIDGQIACHLQPLLEGWIDRLKNP